MLQLSIQTYARTPARAKETKERPNKKYNRVSLNTGVVNLSKSASEKLITLLTQTVTVQVQMKDEQKECLSVFMFWCASTCQLYFGEFEIKE